MVDGHDQQPEHRDHEGGATEEDCAARGRPGGRDRVERLAAVIAFLAIARDHEQCVVDPEREAHAGEHVHDEDRELELLRDERRGRAP